MGMGKKILWWIFWYAIVWFAFACLIAGLSDILTAKPLQAILFFALFIVPGWYATRKVKQKALKAEMEQRTAGAAPQQQYPQPTPPPIKESIKPPQPRPAIQHTADVTPAVSVQPVPKALPNLNEASADDLVKLSGVNRILAMKIISVKEKDGPYSSIEDLFARVQLTTQVQEEVRCHFSIASSGEGRFIDF